MNAGHSFPHAHADVIAVVLAVLVVQASPAARAAAYEDLMPVPRLAVETGGVVASSAIKSPEVVRDHIPGAPSNVRDQAYSIELGESRVRIVAGGEAGERWARVTLDQLRRLTGDRVPCGRIVDWPRFPWRGFMLDTGRNFLDMPSLKDLIDMMARYKLNLFHWHLTEYYAWRLASARYPQLAARGYYDPKGTRHCGKFYSQADFREVVDHAARRGVTVMPELDVPGHAQAFREAFGFKTMRDAGVEEVLDRLFDELCKLVPAERMPFVHLGGDEVWAEKERIDRSSMTRWAETVTTNGRTVVTWDPGQKFDPRGPRIAMLWGASQAEDCAWLDARGWYIEEWDPFEALGRATYHSPFRGAPPDERQLGAVFCAWHDNAVGLPYSRTFRNQPIFPCCVLLGNLYWSGGTYEEQFAKRRLPLAGDPRLDLAIDLERRTVAQRDRALADLRHPFHFVRQTQMRWRMTDASGRLIAKDIAQGSVYPFNMLGSAQNFYHSPTGLVFVETWVRSPEAQEVGAWIGFTGYDRDHGRTRTDGTPAQGEWNKFGARIEINGTPVPPPVWEQPSLPSGEGLEKLKYVRAIDEIPFTNDEWYMREPTRIRLDAGWNHVKMTLPMPRAVGPYSHRWIGTFMPVAGTTDRPREVEGLVYASDPPD